MSKINRKVGIDLNIRSAYLKVDEPTEVYVVWKRGMSTLKYNESYYRPEAY
jgi:hypothetical protein